MTAVRPLIVALAWLAILPQTPGTARLRPDPPITCDACAAWNGPREPFRVFGRTYYVGVAGLSAILIASDSGLILLDGGLPQSAALIDEHIDALGFRTEDIRLIVNSHAHFDHAGGIAALQRASGAVVAASVDGARGLERGGPVEDDPQYALDGRFPAVANVRVIDDGATLRVGDQTITAHLTPGHTPGSTTWTWRDCEADRCLQIVYADSLNAVSAPGFRFTATEASPTLVDLFRRSIATVAELPCDILLSVHPGFSNLDQRLERRRGTPDADAFVDRAACRDYAATARRALDQRVASERRLHAARFRYRLD